MGKDGGRDGGDLSEGARGYYSREAPTLAGVKPQSPDAGPDRIGAGRGKEALTGRAGGPTTSRRRDFEGL